MQAKGPLMTMTTAVAFALFIPAHAADKPFVDVGKQEQITILTPSTPWLPAFTKLVEMYEEQTGNKIKSIRLE